MTPDDQQLHDDLSRDEGRKSTIYFDTVGKQTVGVGHNVDASPLPSDWTLPLTDAQIDKLLDDDITEVFEDLDRACAWWRDMTEPRQRVLANMCFNLGLFKLLQFKNTLAAMQQGRYTAAAVGMIASKWAEQVGARAERLAATMESGE